MATHMGETSYREQDEKNELSEKLRCYRKRFEARRIIEMSMNSLIIDSLNTCQIVVESLLTGGLIAMNGLFTQSMNLTLLVVANQNVVLIFDINALGICQYLRTILTEQSLVKVVHGGHTLCEHIYSRYGIVTQNVYDLTTIEMRVLKRKPRTLVQCVGEEFRFPPILLGDIWNGNLTVSDKWSVRPLQQVMQIEAAQLVAFLLPMCHHQKNEIEILMEQNDPTMEIRHFYISRYNQLYKYFPSQATCA